MMDERPPRPVISRASAATRPPQPPTAAGGTSLGSAIGCLAAGAWSIFFARWFALSGGLLWLVGGLGFLLVAFGLVLLGISLNEWLDRRARHG